jgi:hypothetical protein
MMTVHNKEENYKGLEKLRENYRKFFDNSDNSLIKTHSKEIDKFQREKIFKEY